MKSAAARATPRTARGLFREGSYTGPTAGFAPGHVQANLVILPTAAADAFGGLLRAEPTPLSVPADCFAGPLVVSMRPIPAPRVDEAYAITARYPAAHGSPVYHGDPAGLGIADFGRPDWGTPEASAPARSRYFGPVG